MVKIKSADDDRVGQDGGKVNGGGRAVDRSRRVVMVVFTALLLDLLAFTMPLPLFPRIVEDFVRKEALFPHQTSTLLSQTLHFVRSIRTYLFSFASSSPSQQAFPAQWDLTILGGLLAALFSFCQFLISPQIGKLSDRYGRKPVLLASMVGNLVSAALWLFADHFGVYAMSRLVGGLSEGNVQLSIACITDVTSPAKRSKSLALVGFAFAIAFTLGPSLGAYFSSRVFGTGSLVDVPSVLSALPGVPEQLSLNSYAVPACMTFVLLIVETIYLAVCLPETRGWVKTVEDEPVAATEATAKVSRTPAQRIARLRKLERIHLAFLFFFAGAEVTLSFLTHNFFGFSNMQNGKLLGFIGVLSSLLQGGYVRRRASTPSGTASLALSGIRTCAGSLFLFSALPFLATASAFGAARTTLWVGAAGLAFVSATVVNSLNALASFETDSESTSSAGERVNAVNPLLEKGAALGRFRSRGQLGRALGPLVTTGLYFVLSPTVAYGVCGLGMLGVAVQMRRIAAEETGKEKATKDE